MGFSHFHGSFSNPSPFKGEVRRGMGYICRCSINTTPTNSVYGAMQDGYVERFDQKISPRPSFPKRGRIISPFGKGGIRGIL